MSVLAIDHVQLGFATGQESLVRYFYGHLLGLDEVHGAGNALRFSAGPQRIDLLPIEDWQAGPPPAHVAFTVHNLAGLRAKLKDAGFAPDESRPLPGHLRFYTADPAGNTLEFLEPEPRSTP